MTDTIDTAAPAVVGAVTRDDLAAMKAADDVVFYHLPPHIGIGVPSIRVGLRYWGDDPKVWTARQQVLFPATDGRERHREIRVESGIRWCVGPNEDFRKPTATGFYMLNTINHVWRTVVSLLRVGDVLSLGWVGDNNNGNLDRVGFHMDELYVNVSRAKLSEPLTFRVGTSVGPDNSARMIKRRD